MSSIAFVNGSLQTDGIFRANFQIYQAAKALGLDSRWIECTDPGTSGGRFEGGQKVIGRKLPLVVLEQGYNRLWRFPHLLRNLSDDWLFLGDPTFIKVAYGRSSQRTIVRLNDLLPLSPYSDRRGARWMFRYAIPRLRWAERIIVYTDYMRLHLPRVDHLEARTFVLPPHTEIPEEEARDHVRQSLARIEENRRLRVIYVATDRAYKNIAFFVELAKVLENDTDPRFDFTLVSKLQPESRRKFGESSRPNLTVTPYIPNIQDAYRSSDVLVFPSLAEGFGLPMLEAISYGMPVLANDIDPIREVVGGGGALLPTSDPQSWARQLRSWATPQGYRSAAEHALERARDYSYDRFLRRVRMIFE